VRICGNQNLKRVILPASFPIEKKFMDSSSCTSTEEYEELNVKSEDVFQESIPAEFGFEICGSDWEKLKPKTPGGKLDKNWVNYINRGFENVIKYCVLAIKSHKVKDDADHPRAVYFYARGYCTITGCPAKYVISANKKPGSGEPLRLIVR
jgi:hypothetical protein